MPVRLGSRHVLVATLVALAFVPGSMSASERQPQRRSARRRAELSRQERGELGVTRADVADLVVTSRYRSAHSGVTHVNLNQRFRDLEVFGGHVTVNVADRRQRRLRRREPRPRAGGLAVRHRHGRADRGRRGRGRRARSSARPPTCRCSAQASGPSRETVVSDGGISEQPIPLRLGWQPTGSGLRAAW